MANVDSLCNHFVSYLAVLWPGDKEEPVGVRLVSPVLLRGSRENSLTCVAGDLNNFPGLPFTPPDTEVLDGRELGPSAVAIPSSVAASQYALNGTAV